MKLLYLFLLVSALLAEDIDSLLREYKDASELSKFTKIDTAGFVEVFTRKDIEQMQAYSLKDILKNLTALHFGYAPNYLSLFLNISASYIPPNLIRVYIDDHDISSASFGSGLILAGDMPVEFIDHIEVYKGTSSIEFGNETGMVVIKVYTKLAQREEGKKIRLVSDSRGSVGADSYIAKTFYDGSLFFYLHGFHNNKKSLENSGYAIKRGKQDQLFFIKLKKRDMLLESGSYKLDKDPFLGKGVRYHPTGGGLNARHSFIRVGKSSQESSLFVSYDHIDYYRGYQDASGIYTSKGFVKDYRTNFEDSLFSIEFKKRVRQGSHSLLLGGFYKYKGFRLRGSFDGNHTFYSNALHLFSLYAEDIIDFDDMRLIFSAKEDLFRYNKAVKDKNALTLRAGWIKRIGAWKLKSFLTKTSIPPQFFYQYSSNNYPYITNPNLKFFDGTIFLASMEYLQENSSFALQAGWRKGKNIASYHPTKGFFNLDESIFFRYMELCYTYRFDSDNRVDIALVKGENSKAKLSPDVQCNIRLFNRLGKFDIYNELLYKNSYSYAGQYLKSSYDYTLALKYHINHDLSIGLRGENLLNKGFRQAYRGVAGTFPVTDRTVLVNMEYTF